MTMYPSRTELTACGSGPVDRHRPEPVDRGPGDGDHQPGIVGLGVGVDEARAKALGLEVGDVLFQLVDRDPPMTGTRPVEATQQVVENEPGPEGQRRPASLRCPVRGVGQADVRVDRNHELEGFEQIVGDPGQNLLLPEAFGHQLELELGEVADPPVEQLGRPPRSARREDRAARPTPP